MFLISTQYSTRVVMRFQNHDYYSWYRDCSVILSQENTPWLQIMISFSGYHDRPNATHSLRFSCWLLWIMNQMHEIITRASIYSSVSQYDKLQAKNLMGAKNFTTQSLRRVGWSIHHDFSAWPVNFMTCTWFRNQIFIRLLKSTMSQRNNIPGVTRGSVSNPAEVTP